ncbi:DNA-binding transcriptional MerR regulator [Parabacteroides sp. PF5-5]|uniref:MerR family transcriptional regulator n=1 Tax=unclassified Parabacteroides TaxID=2649774 RepID=UPI002473DDFD|nr:MULTISPECIES: MerR family transcriptional regulator [unclassified Parabacteroides]MDH6306423.1 DNA-binding transcriptional MerR regulator [Parabacteroides sp. PH5-39]MDH6317425.1 DNA-binding transcriptional MerR regulator [Parabacteroides sp. PF5-13]MDH6321134.1 DNA-binding transcriptional MerR regulator [Parabacteroides sp. PH5-13]MDH6324866.1 DNA-binding transcriptional MerR regulator [Parabacteroides sp. PH5-8]MDH6328610.1 DNA-binding transcriptional MerR regulator [Parabacteroides sp. P
MDPKENKDKKEFYSIKEVADKFGLNTPTLRYWEKEFDILHPHTKPNGVRYYKEEDIESVRLIHYLLKEKGLTLAGARQQLKDNRESTVRTAEAIYRLQQIKEDLSYLQNAFNSIKF